MSFISMENSAAKRGGNTGRLGEESEPEFMQKSPNMEMIEDEFHLTKSTEQL